MIMDTAAAIYFAGHDCEWSCFVSELALGARANFGRFLLRQGYSPYDKPCLIPIK